ncbi:MAG: D-glucuronyl C5-epimerase family protein, partial [Gammaproteobacteria bacterium]|nr:D-glucuronyl C5-epimerase family protein [Gammaproteobacteria bacterium]
QAEQITPHAVAMHNTRERARLAGLAPLFEAAGWGRLQPAVEDDTDTHTCEVGCELVRAYLDHTHNPVYLHSARDLVAALDLPAPWLPARRSLMYGNSKQMVAQILGVEYVV